jgi:dCMP deaminase
MKQCQYDKVMMKTAKIWSDLSPCKRLKVGAVLAKDNRILANGYNGTVHGAENICECYEVIKSTKEYEDVYKTGRTIECPICRGGGEVKVKGSPYYQDCNKCKGYGYFKSLDKTNDLTVHAEQNIISFCAKHGISTLGASMYITHAPCKQCSKLMVQAGIDQVYYDKKYKDDEGIRFLKENGVQVWKT